MDGDDAAGEEEKTGPFHTTTYSPLKLAVAEHRRPSLLVNQSALPKRRLFSNSMSEDSVPEISSQEMENAGKTFHPVASASSVVAVILFSHCYFAL